MAVLHLGTKEGVAMLAAAIIPEHLAAQCISMLGTLSTLKHHTAYQWAIAMEIDAQLIRIVGTDEGRIKLEENFELSVRLSLHVLGDGLRVRHR